MKEKIIRVLKESKEYISGQKLCEDFGVSRTAIWKVMKQLKEEGYVIEAISNKGYRILEAPDTIKKPDIEEFLDTTVMGKEYFYQETIDSTNTKAKQLAEEGLAHGLVVSADMQNGGRGRRGKVWSSPKGTSISMSVLLKPTIHPSKASMLTLVAGLSMAEACQELIGEDKKVEIKWPNDLVIESKKICGILTEMSSELDYIHYVVIGIGVNVNIENFPEELGEIATSLKIITGKQIKRAEVIAGCLKHFEKNYEIFLKTEDLEGLIEDYNKKLVNIGKTVKVLNPGDEYTGKALGINAQGELLVEKESGEVVQVYAGEVSVRGLYGYV